MLRISLRSIDIGQFILGDQGKFPTTVEAVFLGGLPFGFIDAPGGGFNDKPPSSLAGFLGRTNLTFWFDLQHQGLGFITGLDSDDKIRIVPMKLSIYWRKVRNYSFFTGPLNYIGIGV